MPGLHNFTHERTPLDILRLPGYIVRGVLIQEYLRVPR